MMAVAANIAKTNGHVKMGVIKPVDYFRELLLSKRGDLLNDMPVYVARELAREKRCADAMVNHPRDVVRNAYHEALRPPR